jgi:hypothetical protein
MVKKIATKPLAEFVQETSSQRILLEEYRSLQTRFLNLQDEGVSRMNFFITAASVSIGSILVLGSSNNSNISQYIPIALLIVSTILAIINHYICNFFTHRDIVADRYERGLARIRRYFANLDPALEDYFVTRITDIATGNTVKNTSGMRRSAQITESFLIGLSVSMTLLIATPLDSKLDIVIGIFIVFVSFIFLELYAQTKYRKARLDAEKKMKFMDGINAK